ncbi:hypothetical protein V1525DRAFT_324913, partial [Lipomyces kononenkoae]
PGQSLGSTQSPTTVIKSLHSSYEMQPDGVVFFETSVGEEYKVVVEVGVSKTHDNLLKKARKWIFDARCNIVILLAFYEKTRYSAPAEPISLTSHQMEDDVVQMNQLWKSQILSEIGALEFKGQTWLDEV